MFIIVKLQVGWSVEGLQRMERHGRLHLPALFHIQLEQYKSGGADCLQQVHSLHSLENPSEVGLPKDEVCDELYAQTTKLTTGSKTLQ